MKQKKTNKKKFYLKGDKESKLMLLRIPNELNVELKVYAAKNNFDKLTVAAVNIIQEKLKGGKRTSENEKD